MNTSLSLSAAPQASPSAPLALCSQDSGPEGKGRIQSQGDSGLRPGSVLKACPVPPSLSVLASKTGETVGRMGVSQGGGGRVPMARGPRLGWGEGAYQGSWMVGPLLSS